MKRTALRPILGYEPEEWLPMGPQEGPPLPKWMGIYWPWARPKVPPAPPAPPAPPTPPPPPPVELATLYGLVTDSETGYALPGVRVTLDGYSATTGSNGYYQFANIDPGSYEAGFSKSGYQEDRMVATLIGGQATELSVALIPVAVPPPPPPPPPPPVELATLYGQVIDRETGKPLAGAVVTLDGYQTTTDSSGHYEFAYVEPGSYTITISKAGYEEETKAVTLTAGAAKRLSAEIVPVAAPPPPPPPAPPPVAPILPSPTCPVCDMVFDTWLKWYTHVLVNHPEWLRYKFICPHCGADYSSYTSRALWEEHILIEHPNTPFMPYVASPIGVADTMTIEKVRPGATPGCYNYSIKYYYTVRGKTHFTGSGSVFNAILCRKLDAIRALFLLYHGAATVPGDESYCLLLE